MCRFFGKGETLSCCNRPANNLKMNPNFIDWLVFSLNANIRSNCLRTPNPAFIIYWCCVQKFYILFLMEHRTPCNLRNNTLNFFWTQQQNKIASFGVHRPLPSDWHLIKLRKTKFSDIKIVLTWCDTLKCMVRWSIGDTAKFVTLRRSNRPTSSDWHLTKLRKKKYFYSAFFYKHG